jgi:hypothetical protein
MKKRCWEIRYGRTYVNFLIFHGLRSIDIDWNWELCIIFIFMVIYLLHLKYLLGINPFILAILGFEFGFSYLLVRCPTPWATDQAIFWFSYFSHRVSHFFPRSAWTAILLPGMTGMCHHSQVFHWDGISLTDFSSPRI